MYKIILDTNIIVSAFYTKNDKSNTLRVLSLVGMNEFQFYYNKEIIREYEEVLKREEFGFDKNKIKIFIETYKDCANCLEIIDLDEKIKDAKDLPFYNAYMAIKSDKTFLITGNLKDFPIEANIVSPTHFINIISKNS